MRTRRALKWAGTTFSLLLLVAFAYNTRRAIIWDSADARHQGMLGFGTITYAWRPPGWEPRADGHPVQPGWSTAHYGLLSGSPGFAPLRWRVARETNSAWESISVPLWLPFAAAAIPTAMLWYRDRRAIPQALSRLAGWLRPRYRKRVTFWLIAAFCVVHAAVAVGANVLAWLVYDFFVPLERIGESRAFDALIDWEAPILLLGTPVWAVLWAWLWVRLRNRLLERGPAGHCRTCGYNLTGNVTGRCPECGSPIAPAQ